MAAVTLFKWIACSTVMATCLVFIVLIIKMVFKNKLSAKMHYFIWMLVLLKLLIPFGPQSQLSIFNLFSMTDQKITEKSYDVMDKISTATTGIASCTPIPCFNEHVKGAPSSQNAEGANKTVSLSILGLFIWLIGALIVGISILKRNFKFSRELKVGNEIVDEEILYCLKECKRQLGIKRTIIIKEVHNLGTPALYGIFRPVLLIPSHMAGKCSTEQIKHAIYHEIAHLKRRDIPMKFLLSALLVIHWFNPLIWYAFYKMRQDTELACDELVLSHLDPLEQKRYGLTLIRLIESFSPGIKPINAVAFLDGKALIRRRISMIASYRKSSLKLTIAAILVFLMLTLAAFTNAVESIGMDNNVMGEKIDLAEKITLNITLTKDFESITVKDFPKEVKY